MGVPASERTLHGIAAWIATVLLGAWLLHPIFTPAHVEGFSASIVSLALHLNAGQLADYDRLHPANLEYFTLSRLGTVAFVSLLTGPMGVSGSWAIRITTWLGFVGLVTSSFVLARRWTNASSFSVILGLLLIAGLGESSFFFNDTIFAAALGTTALAVFTASPALAASALSGALLGAAIVARLDAALLAPAVVLIGYGRHGITRAFWGHALVFTAGSLVPLIAIPTLFSITLRDIVGITRSAIVLWGGGFRPAQHARELSFFLGIPAAMLAALGCIGLVRIRDHRRALLLIGMPVLFNMVALGKIWQSRQLLPLTPFVTALIVLGWRHVVAMSKERDASALKWTVVAVCAFAFVSPAFVVRVSDGPRAPYGRLWTPLLWTRWQRAVNDNQNEIRTLVAKDVKVPTAIVTDSWDADRYLHLALQESGYRQQADDVSGSPCAKTAETFLNGGQRIVHIRLHQPFLPNWRQLAASRLETWGVPCLARRQPQRVLRLSPLEQLSWFEPDSSRSDLIAARSKAMGVIVNARYSPQLIVDVRPSDMAALGDAYSRQAANEEEAAFGRRLPPMPLAEAERLMAARVWDRPPFSSTSEQPPNQR